MSDAVVICPHCLTVRRVPSWERARPWHRRCREKVLARRRQRATAGT